MCVAHKARLANKRLLMYRNKSAAYSQKLLSKNSLTTVPATKPLLSPPKESPSRSKPKIQRQIVIKNQVGRQSNKTILFPHLKKESVAKAMNAHVTYTNFS